MHREDFINAPVGHLLADQDSTSDDFVARLARPLDRGLNLPACEPARRFDAALNHIPRLDSWKPFRGMIRLLGPRQFRRLDQLHPTTVYDAKLTVVVTEGNKRRPPGMSLQPK